MTIEAQKYCDRGHELTEDNLYVSGNSRCCRLCTLERSANRYLSLSAEDKETLMYRQAIRQTGRTKDEYEQAYQAQNGLCAVCGKADIDRRLASDHDHICCSGRTSCGKCVRGFLCRTCNQGIGFFLDSPELLRTAAAYLESWRRQHDGRTIGTMVPDEHSREELPAHR